VAFVATGCSTSTPQAADPSSNAFDNATATTPAATSPAASATGGGGTTPVEDLPASWKLCQNQLRGSSMGYPGDWFTTSLGASDKCSLFNETEFTIVQNAEYPLVAMSATQADAPLASYIADATNPADVTVQLKENTTVAGKAAVKFETTSLGQGLYDAGTRFYGYAIDRGTRTFVLMTVAVPGETKYNSRKFIVDTAKGTLRFL
jgi:hypothetical protein